MRQIFSGKSAKLLPVNPRNLSSSRNFGTNTPLPKVKKHVFIENGIVLLRWQHAVMFDDGYGLF